MAVTIDHLVRQVRNAFAQFKRPPSVVVHEGNKCFDCPSVAALLADSDCEALLSSDELVFDKIPMDCLNADAIRSVASFTKPHRLSRRRRAICAKESAVPRDERGFGLGSWNAQRFEYWKRLRAPG